MQALLTCLTPLAAQVGQVHVDNLGGLLSTWIALLGAVETAAANKNSSESARRTARAALQAELFKNLLTISLAFPNDQATISMYCPQHLLENQPPAGVPAEALLSIGAFDPGSHQATFHLAAEGATAFTLQRRLHGAATFADVAAGIVATAGTATYVDTPGVPGQYEYRALGLNANGPGEVSPLLRVDVAAAA